MCPGHRFIPAVYTQLAVDLFNVPAHRFGGKNQPLRDPVAGISLKDERKNITFARGEGFLKHGSSADPTQNLFICL